MLQHFLKSSAYISHVVATFPQLFGSLFWLIFLALDSGIACTAMSEHTGLDGLFTQELIDGVQTLIDKANASGSRVSGWEEIQ